MTGEWDDELVQQFADEIPMRPWWRFCQHTSHGPVDAYGEAWCHGCGHLVRVRITAAAIERDMRRTIGQLHRP